MIALILCNSHVFFEESKMKLYSNRATPPLEMTPSKQTAEADASPRLTDQSHSAPAAPCAPPVEVDAARSDTTSLPTEVRVAAVPPPRAGEGVYLVSIDLVWCGAYKATCRHSGAVPAAVVGTARH